MITFTIPGQPVGKGRPRIGKVGPNARMFTPATTVAYEGLVALAAHQAMGGRAPLEGPVSVEVMLWCQVPASWSAKKRRAALAGEIRPATKPDLDNAIKGIFDGMNGVVWKDDVQAVALTSRKLYAEAPCAVVTVESIGGQE